jgi:hypothetical protein
VTPERPFRRRLIQILVRHGDAYYNSDGELEWINPKTGFIYRQLNVTGEVVRKVTERATQH